MKPLVQNAADKEQVKDAAGKEKRGRDREIDDVAHLLADVHGRRFLWRVLEECGVYHQSFNHSGSIMSFNEGKRSVGLLLLRDIMEASPEAYVQMMKEFKGELNV